VRRRLRALTGTLSTYRAWADRGSCPAEQQRHKALLRFTAAMWPSGDFERATPTPTQHHRTMVPLASEGAAQVVTSSAVLFGYRVPELPFLPALMPLHNAVSMDLGDAVPMGLSATLLLGLGRTIGFGGIPLIGFGGMLPTGLGGMPPIGFGGTPLSGLGGMPPIGFGGTPLSGLGGMPPVGLCRAAPVYLGGAAPMGLGRASTTGFDGAAAMVFGGAGLPGVGAAPHPGFDAASPDCLCALALPVTTSAEHAAVPTDLNASSLHGIGAATEVFADARGSGTTAPQHVLDEIETETRKRVNISRTPGHRAAAEGFALKQDVKEKSTSSRHKALLSPDCERLMSSAESFAHTIGRRTSAAGVSPTDDAGAMACSACSKLYHTAEGLRLHHRNHHSADKRWRCFAAGCEARSFARRTDLRVHVIRTHSAERPYPCEVASCEKQFACRSELRKHVRTKHAEDVAAFTERVPPAESSQEGQNLFSS